MKALAMDTSHLVRLLSQDGAVRARLTVVLAGGFCAGIAIAALMFLVAIGPRPDILAAARTPRFLFKFIVTGALAVSAGLLVFRLSRPDPPPGAASWALLAAPLLLVGAGLAELVAMPPASWPTLMIGENAAVCLTVVPLLSIGPLACLLLAMRDGAPANPGAAGAVAGLAASGVAASFYAANCTDDSPLFVLAWYPLAVAVVAAAGFFIGRRALRW